MAQLHKPTPTDKRTQLDAPWLILTNYTRISTSDFIRNPLSVVLFTSYQIGLWHPMEIGGSGASRLGFEIYYYLCLIYTGEKTGRLWRSGNTISRIGDLSNQLTRSVTDGPSVGVLRMRE